MRINKKGFLSLLSIIITLAIACILAYTMLNAYLNRPSQQIKVDNVSVSCTVTPATYRSVINSTKEKVQDLQQQGIEQLDQLQ